MPLTSKPTRSDPAYSEDLDLAEAALEGEVEAVARVQEIVQAPTFAGWLIKRGATPAEADDLLGDLMTDCFGGERARGGLHRLLGRFNGGCTLKSFLHRVALNRLISLKRKQEKFATLGPAGEDEDRRGEDPIERIAAVPDLATEDQVLEILRDAVKAALAEVSQEKLVLFRLVHSYGVRQNQIAQMWEWHDAKVSRSMTGLAVELRDLIMAKVRDADPWLQVEWEDCLGIMGESIDLFDA